MSTTPDPPPGLDAGPARAPALSHVLVLLGARQIAVRLTALAEIAEVTEVTPLPLAPRWLRGITNLRGSVVPVLDLAALLGWEGTVTGSRALVLRDGRYRLALPITTVQAVRALALDAADAPVAEEPAAGAPLVRQLLIDDRPTWVVSADAVLAQVRQGDQVGVAGR